MYPEQYFRSGVGAVIANSKRLVLALERVDIPGAWQLPQGGIEHSEELLHAVLREVAEETSIPESDLELVDAYPEPLVYELPVSAWSEKTGRGQVQYWFLFRFYGDDSTICVQRGGEFRTWKWLPFQSVLTSVVDFRKLVYQRLFDRFNPSI